MEVDAFLDGDLTLPGMVSDHLKGFFAEKHSRLDVLVNKFRLREDLIPSKPATALIKGFSELSDVFPQSHPDDVVVGGGTRHEIARLLMHLLNAVDSAERRTLLLEVAKNTPDILFSYDFAVMMCAFGDPIETSEKGAWVIVNSGVERDVNKTVVERIAKCAEKECLEEFNFGWAQDLYIFWFHHDAVSLSAYYQKRLSEGLFPFLQSLGGMARFDTTGTKSFKYSVSRQLPWFTMLCTMIDAQKVADLIDAEFPDLQIFEVKPEERLKRIASAYLDAYRPLHAIRPSSLT